MSKITLLNRTLPNMSGIGNIRVLPGINRFTEAEVTEMKKNPAWQEMLDCGVHKLVTAKKENPGDSKAKDTVNISEMNSKDAQKIIAQTYDRDALHEMMEEEDRSEKRKGVLDAIDKQIEKFTTKKKEDDGK